MSDLLSLSRKALAPKPGGKTGPDQLPALIGAFESETQAVIGQTAPYSDRAILHGLAIIVVVAFILMCVLKLDRVVVSTGKIVPTSGSYFVQPLEASVIKSIEVHVGEVVRKGQVLAYLDPTFAGADATTLENKRASDAALVARLEAEQAGRPFTPKADNRFELLQLADWNQRQAQYRQGLANLDAQIASTSDVRTSAESDIRNYSQHLSVSADLERRMRELEQSGYGASMKTLSAQDARIDATRQVEEAKSQAAKSTHDLAALRAQRAVFITQWNDAIATALVQARNDLNQSTQDLIKATRTRDLTSLTAPGDAVVLQIAPASAGSVVMTGPQTTTQQPLFTLTPLGGPVEADADIPAQDVGFVKVGQTVRVKLDAYRYTQHGTAEGVVKTVSEGSFTTDDNGQAVPAYFKVRVRFTKVHLRNVPADFRLVPGLTISGDILVGSRTIMSYLVEGALRTGSEAMREP
jgi:HlyD family type I secretion membrane fusion protein